MGQDDPLDSRLSNKNLTIILLYEHPDMPNNISQKFEPTDDIQRVPVPHSLLLSLESKISKLDRLTPPFVTKSSNGR